MNKVLDKPVQIGEKKTRYTCRIYDDPSDIDTKTVRLHGFLAEFVNQPSLLQCGPTYVQKMAIYHDGERWMMAGESEAEDV